VGDNLEWEVVIPKGMGFTCIWRDKHGAGLPPYIPHDRRPDAVIDQFHEVLDLIDKARNDD
jgi:FMN phosphatase YigB (HAD superfamily)